MDVAISVFICFFSYAVKKVNSVPPDICFEQFKWEDCGMPPKAVLYYYKSGSRCEVGIWRGCQPNPNMFADEYECVQTCIFSVRARPEDYHNLQVQNEIGDETAVEYDNDATTDAGFTGGGNVTGTGGETGAAGDTGATGAGDEADGDAATATAEEISEGGEATVAAADAGGEVAAESEVPAEGEAPPEGEAPHEGEAPAAPDAPQGGE